MRAIMNKQKNIPLNIKAQTGFTLWSFLFTAGVVLLFMYVGFLLVPIYASDNAISKALTASVDELPAQEIRKKILTTKLDRRLYIDGVYEGPDLKEVLEVEKTREGTNVKLEYRENVHLFFNIGMHLDFKHEIKK